MATKRVRLSAEAYESIAMHAAKYGYSPVFGYLIGSEKNSQVIRETLTRRTCLILDLSPGCLWLQNL
jgi:hypothetical protein